MHVVSGSWDESVWKWNVITGKMECILQGNWSPVRSIGFSPDETCVVAGSEDKSVQIFSRLGPIVFSNFRRKLGVVV